MSAHTPGPWIHATDIGQVGSVETQEGLVVAQTQALVRDYDRSERNANARLIAAAPDLLEVAEMVLGMATVDMPQVLIDAAGIAAAKARGRAS